MSEIDLKGSTDIKVRRLRYKERTWFIQIRDKFRDIVVTEKKHESNKKYKH